MNPFAADLKAVRLARGLSLDQVHRLTRIAVPVLTALESGNFSLMPTPYIKGFLTEYADALDLPRDAVLGAYDASRRNSYGGELAAFVGSPPAPPSEPAEPTGPRPMPSAGDSDSQPPGPSVLPARPVERLAPSAPATGYPGPGGYIGPSGTEPVRPGRSTIKNLGDLRDETPLGPATGGAPYPVDPIVPVPIGTGPRWDDRGDTKRKLVVYGLAGAAGVVVLGLLIWLGWRFLWPTIGGQADRAGAPYEIPYDQTVAEAEAYGVDTTAARLRADSLARADSGRAQTEAAAPVGAQVLTVSALGDVWISVKPDTATRAFEGTLQEGTTKRFVAKASLRCTFGMVDRLDIRLNGKPVVFQKKTGTLRGVVISAAGVYEPPQTAATPKPTAAAAPRPLKPVAPRPDIRSADRATRPVQIPTVPRP